MRLQRILLLRQLGLGLPQIGDVLDREVPEDAALTAHLQLLQSERERLDRQIRAVTTTIRARQEGAPLMAEEALDGFDHTQHREEVEARWGREAYARSDSWWRGMSEAERGDWKQASARLGADWTDAAARGVDPVGDEAQALAARHVAWLRGIPGTPAADGGDLAGYVTGLGEMYVADPRFAANYGGETCATLVRDALRAYVASMPA